MTYLREVPVVTVNLLEAAFRSEFVPVIMSGTNTHDAAVRFVAEIAPFVRDAAHAELIVASVLPVQYSGNTLKEVPELYESAIRKFGGRSDTQSRPTRRRSLRERVLDLFDASDATIFCDHDKSAFLCVPTAEGGQINRELRSEGARAFFENLVYTHLRAAMTSSDEDRVLATLSAKARYGPDAEIASTAVRVGGTDDVVYHDLCRADGRVVEIRPESIQTTYLPSVRFIRYQGQRELPLPDLDTTAGEGFRRFCEALHLQGDISALALGFMIGSLRPKGPYPCLVVEGAQGSGKSVLTESIKRAIDPTDVTRSSLPKDLRDLMVAARQRHLLVLENVSSIKEDMSNALCALSTGAGFETRQLYTDGNTFRISIARPFAINGIGDYIVRPDLLDRAMILRLPPRLSNDRRSEASLWRDFDALLPALLADLYRAVSMAIRRLPEIPVPTEIRMADCAHWLAAAEPATGLPEGSLLEAFRRSQMEIQADLAMNDPVFLELEGIIHEKPFVGRVSELFDKMFVTESRDRYAPRSAAQLSKRLKTMAPAYAAAGITIEFLQRTSAGQQIRITLSEELRSVKKKRESLFPPY